MKISMEEKFLIAYLLVIVIGVIFLVNFFPDLLNAYLAWHVQLGY